MSVETASNAGCRIVNDEVTQTKRGRGRPPKLSKITGASCRIVNDEVTKTKRGRGRPPKLSKITGASKRGRPSNQSLLRLIFTNVSEQRCLSRKFREKRRAIQEFSRTNKGSLRDLLRM